jgi:hypothetical protein
MRAFIKSSSLPSALACGHRSPRLLRFVRTQAQYEYTPREEYAFSEFPHSAGLATPRQVIQLLISGGYISFIAFAVSTVSRRVRGRAARSEEGPFRRVSIHGTCWTLAQLG